MENWGPFYSGILSNLYGRVPSLCEEGSSLGVRGPNKEIDMTLNERQEQLCDSSRWNFSDLSAVFLNCTLKRSPELSHTEGLIQISKQIIEEKRRRTREGVRRA